MSEKPEFNRDPLCPSRLLRAEHDSLLPILHGTPESAFDYPTACPGWSVRDGRQADPADYELTGADAGELAVF